MNLVGSVLALGAAAALSSAAAANWGVVIVGSNTYPNYRHHADGAHAWQLLKANGIPEENLILFMYNDVPTSWENPFQGKLFNQPGDNPPDVYEGIKIDYQGTDVTPDNVIAVLTGDAASVSGGTGRVLQSTSSDRVFLNFVDHGGPGLLGMPNGQPFLYADQVNQALGNMTQNQMFEQLTFYVEACESGSIFKGVLPTNTNIYATTAADATQSSWGTYCGDQAVVNGRNMNTCLGDLYSVNWMQNAVSGNMTETLEAQYTKVHQETTKSNVCQWGDKSFVSEHTGCFEGAIDCETASHAAPALLRGRDSSASTPVVVGDKAAATDVHIDSRLATAASMWSRYLHAEDLSARSIARAELLKELQQQARVEDMLVRAWKTFAETAEVEGEQDLQSLKSAYSQEENFFGDFTPAMWECYRAGNTAVAQTCGSWGDYTMQHVGVVAKMCQVAQGEAANVVPHLAAACHATA